MLELELQKRWVVIVTMSMILHVQLQWRGHGDLGFSGPSVKRLSVLLSILLGTRVVLSTEVCCGFNIQGVMVREVDFMNIVFLNVHMCLGQRAGFQFLQDRHRYILLCAAFDFFLLEFLANALSDKPGPQIVAKVSFVSNFGVLTPFPRTKTGFTC